MVSLACLEIDLNPHGFSSFTGDCDLLLLQDLYFAYYVVGLLVIHMSLTVNGVT